MEIEFIKTILFEQQEEAQHLMRSVHAILREKNADYQKLLSSHFIKVITGVRRCGKSFLSISHLNEPWIYINFDDERFANLQTSDLNQIYEAALFMKPEIKFWIFDEIQNVKNWDLFVNRLQRKGLNIIVTGSNGKLLSKEISTHLTGRSLNLELFPYSFKEYLLQKKVDVPLLLTSEKKVQLLMAFDLWLQDGGFPEAIQTPLRINYLQDLFHRIISRDILQRYNLRNPKGIKQLGIVLMNSISQEISFRKIGIQLGLGSINTTKKYLEYLEDCYLFFQVESFSDKARERQARPRKIYSIDQGMVHAVSITRSENKGRILENIVFLELRRHQKNIYYSKDHDFEVDFLVLEKNKIESIFQVTWSLQDDKTRKREIGSLVKACQKYKVKKGIILTYNEESSLEENGVHIQCIPVYKWLLSGQI